MPSSVVVLGAGPAGATAALFLARRGHAVTVLDSDPSPPPLAEPWERRTALHTRQGHTFLALGTRVLSEEAPDLVDKLIAAGARRVALPHHPSHWNLLARRRLFDSVLRHALSTEPRVRLLAGTVGTGLLVKQATATTPPHVFGIKTTEGDITADIVVDAGGSRSPIPRWLAANQVELKIFDDPTSFLYITRHYRLRAGASFPSIRLPILAPLDFATLLVFPEDNHHFQLSVQLDRADLSRRALRNAPIFERLLAEISIAVPWLEAGEPISDTEPNASVGNCRKRTYFSRPMVTGLLLVGDAAVHTNPSAGRGVALALAHARALADVLDYAKKEGHDSAKLAENWEQITSELFDPWLNSQIQIDHEHRIRIRASIEGRQWAISNNNLSSRLSNGLMALRDCPIVGAAGDRLFNLLSPPEDIYRNREVMRRVLRETRSGLHKPVRIGPSRQEYERLIRETQQCRSLT